jgi:pentose-5-phosphate-3-epimerase
MRFSVSAVCLARDSFEANVMALLDYPVTDLHCDFFPELGMACSLSPAQLVWCVGNWPRRITVHLWGELGLRQLPAELQQQRLLTQLHDATATQLEPVRRAAGEGLHVGVSVSPAQVGSVMAEIDFPIFGVQVLSTTTPGHVGGRFLRSSIDAVDHLRAHRRELAGDWSIEVDGGLDAVSLAALRDRCDLAVLGTNFLRSHPATGHQLPDRLLEASCLTNSTT